MLIETCLDNVWSQYIDVTREVFSWSHGSELSDQYTCPIVISLSESKIVDEIDLGQIKVISELSSGSCRPRNAPYTRSVIGRNFKFYCNTIIFKCLCLYHDLFCLDDILLNANSG